MTTLKTLLAGAAGLVMLTACETYDAEMADDAPIEMASMVDLDALQAALDAQSDEAIARYDARNPALTLSFFGIEPGMTVAEALPGGGWYTKILLPYLGPEGTLIGAHYPDDMWANFGWDEDRVAARVKSTAEWPETAAAWDIENAAEIKSVQLTKMPAEATGQLDAVLFIRALHNIHRFESEGQYMSKALAEAFRVLKPGGVVGVVQHEAPEGNTDEWASGANGYLKRSAIISEFEAAGFILEAESDVNANPKDMPSNEDFVWRLPPSLAGTEEGTPERAAMEAIGESNRMTLLFRKPA